MKQTENTKTENAKAADVQTANSDADRSVFLVQEDFRDFPTKNYYFLKQWERIYLTEGAAGFMVERRGQDRGFGRT